MPTLRHYFGSREDVVEAVLVEQYRLGEGYIARSREPTGPLTDSIRDYLNTLVWLLTEGPRIGDVFAAGFVEGLLHERLGPAYLANMLDPLVEALVARLDVHRRRGELVDADLRQAALMLISPVLVASHHQQHMFGREARPLDLKQLAENLAAAFVRAFGRDDPQIDPSHTAPASSRLTQDHHA